MDEFVRIPYLNVLTYPRPSLRSANPRLSQLKRLGVEEIIFEGRTKLGRLGLVGLGTVSVVVKVVVRGRIDALKIRRMDANRESMIGEYKLTQMANRTGVGAYAFEATRDMMVVQLVEGEELEDHVTGIGGKGTRARLREIVHVLLNQCRKLDLVGLDHGQLSDLRKHVIMAGDFPYIIDFESASLGRRAKNVTTTAQYLFIGGRISPRINRMLGIEDKEPLLLALREYRRDMSDGNYARLLKTMGIVI